MTRVSGSKLHLLVLCQWWAQEGVPWTDGGPVKARNLGLAFHQCIEIIVNEKRTPLQEELAEFKLDENSLALVFAWLRCWEAHYRALGGARMAEASYGFDPITGGVRFLGQSINREYEKHGKLPHEIPCSLDLVVVDDVEGKRHVTVYDWKTGAQRHTQHASENRQLHFGAVCAARHHNADVARVVVAYVDEDGVREDVHPLDAFALDITIPAEIADLDAKTRANPRPQPGMHCRRLWCPAFSACPETQSTAHAALVLAAPAPAESGVALSTPPQAPWRPLTTSVGAIEDEAHARSILVRLEILETWLCEARKALNQWVDLRGPICLSEKDNEVYAAVEKERETIVLTEETREYLRSMLGTHLNNALKVTITKKAIEEATRAIAGPGKPRMALKRELMTGLEERCAVKRSQYTTHEAVRLKKERAA